MLLGKHPIFRKGMDVDEPIYRIFPKKYLKQLLSGMLVLRSVSCWPDPYENFVPYCGYHYAKNGRIEHGFLDRGWHTIFGQCWTANPKSEAMWRIYSQFKPSAKPNSLFSKMEGVRLRTTPQKLANSIAQGLGTDKMANIRIAPVQYMEEKDLTQYVANAIGTYRDQAFAGVNGHADSLLLKRIEFDHEKEVRVLYMDMDNAYVGKPQIEIPIDPNYLIEEIVLDPRVHGGGQEQRRTQWLRRNGFRNEITRSSMYQRTLMVVKLFRDEELRITDNQQADHDAATPTSVATTENPGEGTTPRG